MDERAQLNPLYVTNFIKKHLIMLDVKRPTAYTWYKVPLEGLTTNYGLKVPTDLHTRLKYRSLDNGLPMNEMIGRLFQCYYNPNPSCVKDNQHG